MSPYSSMEGVIERNKDSYYLALRRTQQTIRKEEQNWEAWLVFFLKTMVKQKDNLAAKVNEEQALRASLPALSRQILELVRTRGEITVKEIEYFDGRESQHDQASCEKKLGGEHYLAQVGRGAAWLHHQITLSSGPITEVEGSAGTRKSRSIGAIGCRCRWKAQGSSRAYGTTSQVGRRRDPDPMQLPLQFLLWGAITTSVAVLATRSSLRRLLRENWKSLVFIILLAFIWRLPFEGRFFYGLEYEDSYVYPVAARYLAFNTPHAAPGTSRFLTTVCAVGSWKCCRNPETSSGHFLGYPSMIAVVARIFGYSPMTGSYISFAASLISVVFIFLVGKLLDSDGISGIAGALIFSVTPIFAVQGGSTYAEPVSNMLVVLCLLICLYLLGGAFEESRSGFSMAWLALTFTALLAIVVKRENLLVVPVVLAISTVVNLGQDRKDARIPRFAVLLTTFICIAFALNQLRLPTVIRREQAEYSIFPFSIEIWRTMMPMFSKAYLSLSWYFGTIFLVAVAIVVSIRSRTRALCVLALFASYLLLYTSHVRSYYQLRGSTVTEFDALRYSMNLAGLWSIMAGLGLSTLTRRLFPAGLDGTEKRFARRFVWVCIACALLGSWVVTDRVKEDMVANEFSSRIQPAEAALQAIERVGNPDTFVISVEPLVVQLLARNPTNVIDFKDLTPGLLQELRAENPNATFFYVEQDIHNSQADLERYRESFYTVDTAQKKLLGHGADYRIFEIL